MKNATKKAAELTPAEIVRKKHANAMLKIAADLAAVGFTGATRILEGERGFFRALTREFDASRVTDGLGTRWKIGENGYKLY